jgi:adenine deaminase
MRSTNLPAKQSALLAAARGDTPADLLLRDAAMVNVFSGQIERGDIAVLQDTIVGIGPGYDAKEQVDLRGAFVTPGLIDAHVHIESSLCVPAQFAAAVVPRGVTCAVTDPHEIANVGGEAGLLFMVRSAQGLPLRVVTMAPSCVPATHMESNGARLDADELADLLASGTVHGLAEVMNFPGVIQGDRGVWAKLEAFRRCPIDGHAPALSGKALNAYAVAGIGSEHECTTVEEAAEKLARGFYIFLREATNAHDLRTLLPLVNVANARRICFCTDDRMASDLIDEGSIDAMVRTAIASGIDPITALRMATLNPAEWYGLPHLGALAPGRAADLLVVDDLADFRPRQVYVRGRLVAEDGRLRPEVKLPTPAMHRSLGRSVRIDWSRVDLAIPAEGRIARVIGTLEDQLITEERLLEVAVEDGLAVADPGRDLLKIAVIERHRASGNVGLGFIQGLGLRRGAIAGTVAHDHHNLVVIGADDLSMLTAARAVAELHGGLAVADGAAVRAQLPLPVAGLMSDRPAGEVRRAYDDLLAAAAALGSPLHDPFMAMSFMALEVIPKLKLTDRGLVDVEKFDFVGLFI